jgi:hypothetical protein
MQHFVARSSASCCWRMVTRPEPSHSLRVVRAGLGRPLALPASSSSSATWRTTQQCETSYRAVSQRAPRAERGRGSSRKSNIQRSSLHLRSTVAHRVVPLPLPRRKCNLINQLWIIRLGQQLRASCGDVTQSVFNLSPKVVSLCMLITERQCSGHA